jgi:hypothetical protein
MISSELFSFSFLFLFFSFFFLAVIHTAAASALGKMLVKMCADARVPLINVVRRAEQVLRRSTQTNGEEEEEKERRKMFPGRIGYKANWRNSSTFSFLFVSFFAFFFNNLGCCTHRND